MLNSSRDKGMRDRSPLYDSESKLYYWKGERKARIILSGIGKRKEVKRITAAGIIRYPSKFYRSTRSGLTALVLCNWSMYN